jgi:hypothetical protein
MLGLTGRLVGLVAGLTGVKFGIFLPPVKLKNGILSGILSGLLGFRL